MTTMNHMNLLQDLCTKLSALLKEREIGCLSWNQFLVDECKELYAIFHAMGLAEYMNNHPEELKKLLDKKYIV